MTEEPRPAFYALASGGWRDYVTVLHVPYTLWHLSYVVIGAALAPAWLPNRLVAALVAFFLALGIGAHALDELHGRPLGTRIPERALWALAVASIGSALAIGVAAALAWTLWLLALVAFGGFIVIAYNLELFDGAFHSDAWFAVGWGALPVLAAYLAAAERLSWAAVTAAIFAASLSYAQRCLSTPVRRLRREVRRVSGTLELGDAHELPITREVLTQPSELALRAMTVATIALSVALVLTRV